MKRIPRKIKKAIKRKNENPYYKQTRWVVRSIHYKKALLFEIGRIAANFSTAMWVEHEIKYSNIRKNFKLGGNVYGKSDSCTSDCRES